MLVDTVTLTAKTTPSSSEIIYGSGPETLTTVTEIVTNPKDPDFIGVTLTGTLTDSDGHFMGSPVELAFSATQTPGNIPSVAFSNASTASTIPEPSTWVMMTLGFGALGCAAFGRRRANVALLPA
jgi:hypothetical protein